MGESAAERTYRPYDFALRPGTAREGGRGSLDVYAIHLADAWVEQ